MKSGVKSVEEQKFTNYEIIIIDDGSKDGTPIIADKLREQYSNIHVIHQDNQGLSAARNAGIRIASGEYCLFLDGDDKFAANSLQELAECIHNKPDIVVSRFVTLDSETYEMSDCPFTFDKKKLESIASVSMKFKEISHYWLAGWMFCVRTDYIKENNLFFKKGLLHEDEEWMPRVALHAHTMAFNNTPYYIYRLNRNGSITNKLNENRIFDSIKIINILQNELKDNTYSDEAKKVMEYRIQTLLFGTINKASMYKEHNRYKEIISQLREKIYLLKRSERIIYRLSYLLCKLIGVEKTGAFFQYIVNMKNYK